MENLIANNLNSLQLLLGTNKFGCAQKKSFLLIAK